MSLFDQTRQGEDHTGFSIFVNCAPMKWCSEKHQLTIELRELFAKCVALKTCVEEIEHMRFKLQMFGVPVVKDHATNVSTRMLNL